MFFTTVEEPFSCFFGGGENYECSHFDALLSGVSSTPFCRGGNLQYPRIFG